MAKKKSATVRKGGYVSIGAEKWVTDVEPGRVLKYTLEMGIPIHNGQPMRQLGRTEDDKAPLVTEDGEADKAPEEPAAEKEEPPAEPEEGDGSPDADQGASDVSSDDGDGPAVWAVGDVIVRRPGLEMAGTETQKIKVPLTDEELGRLQESIADAYDALKKIEEAHSVVKAQWRLKIKEAKDELNKLSDTHRAKYEEKQVLVDVMHDYATGQRLIVFEKAVFGLQTLKEADRQLPLVQQAAPSRVVEFRPLVLEGGAAAPEAEAAVEEAAAQEAPATAFEAAARTMDLGATAIAEALLRAMGWDDDSRDEWVAHVLDLMDGETSVRELPEEVQAALATILKVEVDDLGELPYAGGAEDSADGSPEEDPEAANLDDEEESTSAGDDW